MMTTLTQREVDLWIICCMAFRSNLELDTDDPDAVIESIINDYAKRLKPTREEVERICQISPKQLYCNHYLEGAWKQHAAVQSTDAED